KRPFSACFLCSRHNRIEAINELNHERTTSNIGAIPLTLLLGSLFLIWVDTLIGSLITCHCAVESVTLFSFKAPCIFCDIPSLNVLLIFGNAVVTTDEACEFIPWLAITRILA